MNKYIGFLLVPCLWTYTVYPVQATEAGLREAQQEWLKVLDGDDVNAIMDALAKDALLLPSDRNIIRDRDAIRAYYEEGIKQRNETFEVSVSNLEAMVHGDLGYTLGTYTITDASGKEIARGKYVELWRRENGAWKLSRDISNRSLPPATEKPEDDTKE